MRGDYWLPPAQQARLLRRGMIVGGALTLLWGMAAGYACWGAGQGLQGEKTEIAARRKRLTELAGEVRRRKMEAKARAMLRSEPVNGTGSGLFAGEISQMSAGSRLLVQTFRYGAPKTKAQPDKKEAPPQAAAGDPKTPSTQTDAKPDSPDGMEPMSYEITGSGDFSTLMAFLDQLTALPRVVEIHSIQLTRTGLEPDADRAALAFHISGAFYGRADRTTEKP